MRKRIGAAALLFAYLLPVLLPGTGALAHDVYHALIAHERAEYEGDRGHVHADGDHGHVHAEGGERHGHAPLVDGLLVFSSADDSVAPDPETVPSGTATSHLAARAPAPDSARPSDSLPLRSKGRTLADFRLDPDVPPPRA